MTAKAPIAPRRCAIYTRKSSEEGLDQTFNSLDAQREACEAYAASQRHEGWQVLDTRYDDGGFSGGNLTRPALQRLLADIKAGEVDLVVVYKIDRLTRSLMDFSKLVEIFDAHETSFVSVTQHFNTTSSMGRLTLNVLLSFAQFEREVTGERIRDKIAASKAKGMWMGGPCPLGYRLVDKTLVIAPDEADLVRRIFQRYCALRCVQALKWELDQAGMQGRTRLHRDGTTQAKALSRGALYAILKRHIYIGEVRHHDESFEGQHEAIIPRELWDRTQALLKSNRHERRLGKRATNASLLAGLLVDKTGRKLTATHTTKGGKRYRYYLIRESDPDAQDETAKRLCLPAHDVERIVSEQWQNLLTAQDLDVQLGITGTNESEALRANAERLAKQWPKLSVSKQREVLHTAGIQVVVDERRVELSTEPDQLATLLLEASSDGTHRRVPSKSRRVVKGVDASLIKTAGETRIIEEDTKAIGVALTPGHQSLLQDIARGRAWAKALMEGEVGSVEEIAARTGLSPAHVARGLKCMNITPDLVDRLARGDGPADLTWMAIRKLSQSQWDASLSRWRTSKSKALP